MFAGRFTMKTSFERPCCCIDNFCRKLIDESDCIKAGGKVVKVCSDCK